MIVKNHDLLTTEADIIVQQSNCVTIKSHGLSHKIAEKYPYANPYSLRKMKSANTAAIESRRFPGSCEIHSEGPNKPGPKVACLMAQVCPGKPGAWCRQYNIEEPDDTAEKRLIYFEMALKVLSEYCDENMIKRIAFPYKIGCGLGGGMWQQYELLLKKFDESVGAEVIICKI